MRSLAKNIFSVVCSLLFPSHSLSFYRFNIIFGGKSTMCALMGENVRARRTFWQRTVHNNEKLCVLCKESTPIGEKIKERSDERKKSERREERCRKIKFFDGMTRSYVNESHSWKKQQQQQQQPFVADTVERRWLRDALTGKIGNLFVPYMFVWRAMMPKVIKLH